MKTAINYETNTPSHRQWLRGSSMLELLMVLGVVSSVMAAGYFAMSSLTGTVKAGKLQSDLVALNNAVSTYLTHGGRIPASSDGQQVISQLKTTASRASAKRMSGLKGTMIDLRLRGELITDAGADRAVWNATKRRFEIMTSGTGFVAFDLGADPTLASAEEDRTTTLPAAQRDKWIWDSEDALITTRAPRGMPTTDVAYMEPPTPSSITRLAPPDVSLPGGLYDHSAYSPTLSVSLVDPNEPGTSQMFYSVDNGPWFEYTGTSLQILPHLTSTLRAYAAATRPEDYENSDYRTEKYETIYFSGISAGQFHTPSGDARLMTNIAPGQRTVNFKWGDPATADKRQNELTFTGAGFTGVAPDEEFTLGTLEYYNGTTWSGTNATTVQIAIELDLTTPGVKESLNFTFKLQSTPNGGTDANADADYVWIPDVSTNFRAVIKGQSFALILRFGEHGPDGFTTIDTFHAHEGKALRGTIYGRLTAVNDQL